MKFELWLIKDSIFKKICWLAIAGIFLIFLWVHWNFSVNVPIYDEYRYFLKDLSLLEAKNVTSIIKNAVLYYHNGHELTILFLFGYLWVGGFKSEVQHPSFQ